MYSNVLAIGTQALYNRINSFVREENRMTTIYWAGDSTVKQNTVLTWPQTGIGQMFERYVERVSVCIDNHAENGRSAKSFIDEGRLDILAKRIHRGDFLFIQFGHNDEKQEDPARYADPDGEFGELLKQYVEAARKKKAIPVIITPVTRRGFALPEQPWRHDRWAAAAKRTAKELDVACIDLTAMSEDLLIHTAEDARDRWYMPDGTHLKPEGALMFGGLIAKALYRLGGEYAALLDTNYLHSLQG